MEKVKKGYFSHINLKDNHDKHVIAIMIFMGIDGKEMKTPVYFYNKMVEPYSSNFKRLYFHQDVNFEPVPRDDNKRSSLATCGKSGSGKSFQAGKLAEKYRLLYPNNPIYIISDVDKDPAYDNLKGMVRLPLQELVDEPILDLEELENSMVIFDDIEGITKDQAKAISQLRDSIYTKGRHHNIYVNGLQHNVTDGMKTRLLLQEIDVITVYPRECSNKQIRWYLDKYAELDKGLIDKILNIESRWLTLVFTWDVPLVIWEHGICCISDL